MPNENYIKLIAAHPCFAALSHTEIDELATLAIEKHYLANEIIVSQGDDIDAIYLIMQGEVEVGTQALIANKIQLVPQLVLKKSEAIGLNNIGLFAPEGVRTATLTSITEVVLIGWPINIFLDFLQTHPGVGDATRQSAAFMLRINFIKSVAPFSDLSTQKIAQIARHIAEITVATGTVLFHEGETGNECYLIQSGRVEITITDNNGLQRSVAVLGPPAFFGEIALLSNVPRNATAKMIEGGSLLVLHKTQLQELIESHMAAAEMIASLAMVRSRPVRAPDVNHYHRSTVDGQKMTILKNTKLKRYYQLSPTGWFIWQQLDGMQTIEDITLALFNECKIFSPDAVADIVINLIDNGFATVPAMSVFSPPPVITKMDTSWRGQIKRKLRKIMFIRCIFQDIDKNLTASYHAGVNLLFTLIGQSIIALIIAAGFFVFGLFTRPAVLLLPTISHPLPFVVLLVCAYYLLVVFHEFGHAYTVKALGHEVHRAGILFYWLGLFAFVDTSDMWLSSSKLRILVNLAGPYTDLLVAGIASLCAWLIPQTDISSFFWLLALSLYFSVLGSLNPLHEGDGYYALMNILHNSKLRLNAFNLLPQLKFKSFFDLSFLKKNRQELIYWGICLVFLSLYILLALVAQYYLRLILPQHWLGIPAYHLRWLLPALVVVIFILRTRTYWRREKMSASKAR